MPQTTHEIKQGQPVTIEGVVIELHHTGRHSQGTQEVETAVIVVTTAD